MGLDAGEPIWKGLCSLTKVLSHFHFFRKIPIVIDSVRLLALTTFFEPLVVSRPSVREPSAFEPLQRLRGHLSLPSLSFGSSPRVRGTHNLRRHTHRVERFIPARAGNASTSSRCSLVMAVHPRACGERASRIVGGNTINGSSPRVRGTRSLLDRACDVCRFIPARAGNARPKTPFRPVTAVHPRACGERISASKNLFSTAGSSPRVRGTREHDMTRRASQQVHPRACGERVYRDSQNFVARGSSPRVRGTQLHRRISSRC